MGAARRFMDSGKGKKRKGGPAGKEPKKAKRPFDYSRFRRRKIAVQLAYVGFLIPEGFVQQEPDDSTVEDHLFKSAAKCCLTESRELAEYSQMARLRMARLQMARLQVAKMLDSRVFDAMNA